MDLASSVVGSGRLVLLWLVACSSHERPPGVVDAATADGGVDDGGGVDAGVDDAGTPAVFGNRLAGGSGFSCALGLDRVVTCWGNNGRGELGDGTAVSNWRPVVVVGLADTVEISAGISHACARSMSGGVSCWGYDNAGQLGSGEATLEPRTTPVRVAGLGATLQVSAGHWHTCAVIEDGTVRCWGWNRLGELGDGTTEQRATPVAVTGLENVAEVAAGLDFTCARMRDATVQCWGQMLNAAGGLEMFAPRRVPGLAGVVSLDAGGGHVCAALDDGTARCWGFNTNGELGDHTRVHRAEPVEVFGLRGVVEVEAGGQTCARLESGEVHCWGGFWDSDVHVAPFRVNGIEGAQDLAVAFGLHACVRLADETIRCFGYNAGGETMVGGCCSGGICGIPEGAACGGGTCRDGWCSDCGAAGQACCDRARMGRVRCRESSPLCLDEVCRECGEIGEPCCASDACTAGVCFGGRCMTPGTEGAPCLAGGLCPGGCCVLVGHSDHVCAAAGAACPGPAGVPPRTCAASGSCGGCGAEGEACCPSAESGRVPFYCSAAGMACDPDTTCRAL